jgi:Flp pilus assembly protein TadG
MKKKSSFPQKNHGQILVMYAIMLLVLIAIMGLAIDVGYTYVSYARLRRAVDAAALNASNQIKEGYTVGELEAAAVEFLRLNDVNDPTATVKTCDNTPSMCTTPPRKLVSVSASSNVPTFFMGVLGFDNLSISASAESEAATIDVMLVIDISESMTNNNPQGSALTDPYLCNRVNYGDAIPGECEPFQQVKSAALDFIDQLFYPYDRVGIVTFERLPHETLPLTNDKAVIRQAILDLGVYEAEPCPYLFGEPFSLASEGSICRAYEGYADDFRHTATWPKYPTTADIGSWPFVGMDCPQALLGEDDLVPNCYSTNIGGGLALAGNILAGPTSRNESLWVVIVLSDGAANIGYSPNGSKIYCPAGQIYQFCRDGNPAVRHSADLQPLLYDPDDYARDIADFLYGMEVYTFSIGLGDLVATTPEAGSLLDYVVRDRGIYYEAPDGSQLRAIFLQIANNIATRITR